MLPCLAALSNASKPETDGKNRLFNLFTSTWKAHYGSSSLGKPVLFGSFYYYR